MTWNQTLGLECRSADSYASFGAYLQAQTDLFVESMQDAADNHWHTLSWRMEGASQEEIGAEMERWWNRHIRRFQTRLREEYHQDQKRRLKGRLRRETHRRLAVESQLEETQIELQQTKDSLTVEREFSDYLKEEWRCQKCNRRWSE